MSNQDTCLAPPMVRVYEQALPARRWTERRQLSNVSPGVTEIWKARWKGTRGSDLVVQLCFGHRIL